MGLEEQQRTSEAKVIVVTEENIHVNSSDFARIDEDVVVEASPIRVVRADVDVEGDEEAVVIMEEIDSLILSQLAVDVNYQSRHEVRKKLTPRRIRSVKPIVQYSQHIIKVFPKN